ncbi:hypothetical protein VTJ49DRAFT_6677 [Mycothermus thermophilus]|uniref:CoA-transferase family III n=1 Tax=Humicola insolens TaxID=85995 RepID=A0ABR3V234_HUMIN
MARSEHSEPGSTNQGHGWSGVRQSRRVFVAIAIPVVTIPPTWSHPDLPPHRYYLGLPSSGLLCLGGQHMADITSALPPNSILLFDFRCPSHQCLGVTLQMAQIDTHIFQRDSLTWGPGPAWEGTVDEEGIDGKGRVLLSQQKLILSTLRYFRRVVPPKPALHLTTTSTAAPPSHARHSLAAGTYEALGKLGTICQGELPKSALALTKTVEIMSSSGEGDQLFFPTPLREQEVAAAIKALEASTAAAVAEARYGTRCRRIRVDSDKVAAFLMSAYITTLDGMDKSDPRVRARIPDTDLNRAQSVLYRRMSANLYSTKNPGEYYHIHGSLDADVTLEMLGLPKERPDLTDYHEIIDYIESAVQKHTVAELEALNAAHRQAGVPALTWEQFQATPHGRAIASLPPLTVRPNPDDDHATPPAPWPTPPAGSGPPYALSGIKVLELCRIIAGPTIGRSLAAHGAQVIKVTSPHLPDVPFFQLEVNTGKHTIHLDLRPPPAGVAETKDRSTFAALLADADVVIDGYRPGALARLGYSPEYLASLARRRGKGYVYVAEDCFGGTGLSADAEWASRPGWQQIADCVTGVAWAQGEFMGLDEPVVPPFPMSDYGTGALGSVAALAGLLRRATEGGSWVCRTSLVQYDAFLMSLGLVPEAEQARLRKEHDNEAGFFGLRHSDSVDEVGKRALRSMRIVAPYLFASSSSSSSSPSSSASSSPSSPIAASPSSSSSSIQEAPAQVPAAAAAAPHLMQEAYSPGFGGVIRWPREAVRIEGLRVGHVRTARPNGWDTVKGVADPAEMWEGWEEDIIPEKDEDGEEGVLH